MKIKELGSNCLKSLTELRAQETMPVIHPSSIITLVRVFSSLNFNASPTPEKFTKIV